MTSRWICMLGRLVLAVFCAVGLCAASPIMFRDNFNNRASAASWETVIGRWTFQRGRLIDTPEEEAPHAWIYVASKQFSGKIEVKVTYDQTATSGAEIAFNSTGHLVNEYRAMMSSEASFLFPSRWSVAVYQDGVVRNLVPPDATDGQEATSAFAGWATPSAFTSTGDKSAPPVTDSDLSPHRAGSAWS
jgi:hypothetical protein